MKLKKGDNVEVITGKDKGKRGKIIRVLSDKNSVVVEGVNIRIRHARPRKEGEKGQKIEFPAPLNASNVMLVDSRSNKRTRIGMKKLANGKNIRISKKTGEEI